MSNSEFDINPSPLEILYHDEAVVAINKPAGLLAHRSRIDVHAKEFAVEKLYEQIGQRVYLVHRLDRPTSGVLLFALNPDCARILADQFSNRLVSKTYRAIVRGHTAKEGRIDEDLTRKHDLVSDARASGAKSPQPATTDFTTLRQWVVPFSTGKYLNSRYSEVAINPLTGRKHQIRRHFNHIAHPIIGDSSHGDRRHNRLFREQFYVSRLLLVAQTLEITHPTSGQPLILESPVGSEFEYAIEQLDRFAIQKRAC